MKEQNIYCTLYPRPKPVPGFVLTHVFTSSVSRDIFGSSNSYIVFFTFNVTDLHTVYVYTYLWTNTYSYRIIHKYRIYNISNATK